MSERLNKCRRLFESYDIEALLVTSAVNRCYLTGFTGTSGAVLITENEALLITDFRYVDQAAEQAEGYQVIKHSGPMEKTIAEELGKCNVKRLGFEEQHVTYAAYRKYRQEFFNTELVAVEGVVEQLRLIKDENELGLIREAVAIADRTYDHILHMIRPGMKEIDVATEIEFFMRKQGATSSSFDMIVASGERAAQPHGVASDKVIQHGEFITLDFGALYKGYVSDMTRTFALGEPVAKLKEIYDVCRQAQMTGVENIRPGMSGKEADALCRDMIKAQGYEEHFGHSTGHGIGLEVHEGPRLSSRSSLELRPGMVVTVEPGIYLSGVGGVRIEDDIVITEEGNEILTQSTKELVIVE